MALMMLKGSKFGEISKVKESKKHQIILGNRKKLLSMLQYRRISF